MRYMTILLLVTLAACGSVVPRTAAQLQGFSPLTVDPASLAAAIRMSDGLAIRPGGATLTFGAERKDTGETRMETYVLERTRDAEGREVFALSAADVDAFKAQQARIAAWKAQAPEATLGTFSVQAAPCPVGDGPATGATVSVDIRTDAEGGFVPLVVDAPVAGLLEPARSAPNAHCP